MALKYKGPSCRRYAVTRAEKFPEDRTTVIVDAPDRERAKRLAFVELGSNPDKYIIESLPRIAVGPRLVWRDKGEVRL